jgi:hypothetical protein
MGSAFFITGVLASASAATNSENSLIFSVSLYSYSFALRTLGGGSWTLTSSTGSGSSYPCAFVTVYLANDCMTSS